MRTEVLPLLEQLSPGIVSHLCALADQLLESAPSPPVPGLAHIGTLPRASTEALLALARTKSPKARVRLPKGLVARYDRDQLSIVVATAEPRASEKTRR